ncbi:MAG: flagellar hook-basal body complex protein FliE [Vicinamibacterales bacterium]
MAIDPIAALRSVAGTAKSAAAGGAAATGSVDFGAALESVIESVEGSTAQANQAVGNMLEGTGDVHEAMIAMQRADVMLQLTVQIRNKLVQAYQDVMRMPV